MNELILSITAWDIANGLAVIAQVLFWLILLACIFGQAPTVVLMLWVTRKGVRVTELLLRAWHCRNQKREAIGYLRRAAFELMPVYPIS
ncbi:hypothetical protein [Marinobacter salsuginis]|uniref:Uncharacterized protein n=1 Tax=Marinobacter salsuginis TaxID=418719 RepID=A0A5M3Q276_9GAMM|nr:hypothetical protein [Marinobacter salsuginis]GBO89159.1 hypothetical protein MSSD14B_28270 [Marinobacter salsuginis]